MPVNDRFQEGGHLDGASTTTNPLS